MNNQSRRPAPPPKAFERTKFLCTYCGGRTVENDLSGVPKDIRRMKEPNIIQGFTIEMQFPPHISYTMFVCPWCLKEGFDKMFSKKVSVLLTGKEIDSTKE